MLKQSNICIDDWNDVKKKAYELVEAIQKANDKDFVKEQISEYEQKVKTEPDAVHMEINDRISNIVGSIYTKEESDSKYASAESIPTKTSQLSNDSGFITANDVSTKADKTDVDTKVDKSVFDALNDNIWNGDLASGQFKTVYRTQNDSESVICNEQSGGGFIFTNTETKIKCFSGVNDGSDPNHVYVQMYAINNASNNIKIGPRISLTKDGAFYSTDITRVSEEYEIVTKGSLSEYAKTSDIENAYQPKGTYLTEHQSLAGYAKTADISVALERKADTKEIIAALETKANNSDLLITKSECDLLKAKVEYLEQLISKYLPKAEMINDGKIDDLSSENKAVEISDSMNTVVKDENNDD